MMFLEKHGIWVMVSLMALLVGLIIWVAIDESQHTPYYHEQ